MAQRQRRRRRDAAAPADAAAARKRRRRLGEVSQKKATGAGGRGERGGDRATAGPTTRRRTWRTRHPRASGGPARGARRRESFNGPIDEGARTMGPFTTGPSWTSGCGAARADHALASASRITSEPPSDPAVATTVDPRMAVGPSSPFRASPPPASARGLGRAQRAMLAAGAEPGASSTGSRCNAASAARGAGGSALGPEARVARRRGGAGGGGSLGARAGSAPR